MKVLVTGTNNRNLRKLWLVKREGIHLVDLRLPDKYHQLSVTACLLGTLKLCRSTHVVTCTTLYLTYMGPITAADIAAVSGTDMPGAMAEYEYTHQEYKGQTRIAVNR